MRIYLVSPRNPESFWTMNRILPTLGKHCVFPNLALPTLAGLSPPPHAVTLCDENVEEVDFDNPADVVGITGYIVHKQRMFELIDEFRRRGKRVAVGGPYATLCPEDFDGKADVLFIGEAEETWPRFLADYASGSWECVYRAPRLPELGHGPLPRFDLLRMDRYRAMPMQFSRGCPFNCEFCDIIVMYGRSPRTVDPEQARRRTGRPTALRAFSAGLPGLGQPAPPLADALHAAPHRGSQAQPPPRRGGARTHAQAFPRVRGNTLRIAGALDRGAEGVPPERGAVGSCTRQGGDPDTRGGCLATTARPHMMLVIRRRNGLR